MDIPTRVIDLAGKVYGKLTVLNYQGKNAYGRTTWLCHCGCGNTTVTTANSLNSGKTKSCGCHHKQVVSSMFDKIRSEMIGSVYGRLRVIEMAHISGGEAHYLCQCLCGNSKIVANSALVGNNTKSCGCLGVESRIVHGLSGHPLYTVYQNMKARCYNQNTPSYHRYGGRDSRPVSICSDWLDNFTIFYDWAISSGYREGLTIERKNNDGNYEPGNCQWETMGTQAKNRSTTKLTVEAVKRIRLDSRPNKTIAEEYGIDASTVSRVKSGENWKL